MDRLTGILRLAGLAKGNAPSVDRCTGHVDTCQECKEAGECFFWGGCDMHCSKDHDRACPDDETCCQMEK